MPCKLNHFSMLLLLISFFFVFVSTSFTKSVFFVSSRFFPASSLDSWRFLMVQNRPALEFRRIVKTCRRNTCQFSTKTSNVWPTQKVDVYGATSGWLQLGWNWEHPGASCCIRLVFLFFLKDTALILENMATKSPQTNELAAN